MPHDDVYMLAFQGTSAAEANKLAGDLKTALQELDESLKVDRVRTRADTQDLGATIALVLGTASAAAVAKGIGAWLARHSGARIQISVNGAIVATNLDSRDAARIAEAFARRK